MSLRILLASIVDPARASNGAATVTRNLVRLLESPGLDAAVECIARGPVSIPAHRWRQTSAILRSLVSSLPAKPAYSYSRTLRDRVLRRLDQERVDLVVLNGSDLLWLDPLLPAAVPRLLIAHNIEHLLLQAQAALVGQSWPPLRPMLERECRRMERFEAGGIRSVGNVLFLSSFDAHHPQAGALARRSLVTPPIFSDPVGARPAYSGGELEIGFLGHMEWWPNQRGVAWFLSQVLPRLDRGIRVHLFGRGTERYAPEDPRVTGHGAVADLRAVWERCHLMICPTVTGGGVCTKLAEAVYHGTPVLATTQATRGLPLADDPCIRVSDRADEWTAYLDSEAARTAAAGRVSPALSRQFAADTHRQAVQDFIRQTTQPSSPAHPAPSPAAAP